ncbi:MAG: signal recognition particle protein [Nitrospiraceae bacterium]|jgi:signal recognition particle subunit SRP54|uniref:signal recognition particle protein n=1 Tax=Nitrospira cf. moscoviensis SBR1015 TaxID=96242 RepID=UPI000A0A5AE4|nr:signal recognition particle protein [Nitrospira cf. moscoviensis SBR1015]MBY0249629.1 signal recognition particle protein [Nitrospiraceae bacterium]OQW30711.1 MAG: signal recognition particle protein [Nitrospira sp. SG-bin2]
MFDALSDKFEKVLKKLRGQGVLTEQNITEALKDVRFALLEADVNFKIVKEFIERVRQKAIGQEVLQSLTPGHQVVKIVWDELSDMMGRERSGLALNSQPPTVVMMVGLQGAGKTTTCGKLARLFKQQGKRVLLVAADPRRPAAGEQLSALGRDLGIDVYRADQTQASQSDVVRICRAGVEQGREQGFDLVVLDTGGRLHIDDELMGELVAVKAAVAPQEVLLVADAMTGQDAVTMAGQFDQKIGVTGIILTKVEGDARGGAVLSIRAVTGKPIKFLGVGEKLDALEPFHPDRMASRILGMGDVLSLIEKAQESISREQAEVAQRRLTSNTFTLEDFRAQLGQMGRLGSLDQILGMLPGGQKLKSAIEGDKPEREMGRVAAMIDSMTIRERRDHTIINGSRKKRIARGSGVTVQDVNRLIKQFLSAKKLAKAMTGAGGRRHLAQLMRSM